MTDVIEVKAPSLEEFNEKIEGQIKAIEEMGWEVKHTKDLSRDFENGKFFKYLIIVER